ncbi:ABC transporter substrate-binding protein [Nocardioides sp.]|uniref:ABC transporter substrate-binding protein n=1 Tax=Nocardioides sp. TaxID=35761 RepID=UPI0039E2516C
MKRRALRISAVLATVTLGLAACGSDGSDGEAAETPSTSTSSSAAGETTAAAESFGDISVQLSWIKNAEFAGEFIADSKGYYADAGFGKVDLLTGPVAQEEIVATGKAQFGLSNSVSTAAAVANSGFPLKIVGATYQKNPFSILSLGDQGNITTPADLKGKKIGVQDPNLSLFQAFLSANGLTEDDVTIVPNGFDIAPLEDGEIDGLVAYMTNESLLVKGDGFDAVDLPFADNGLPFVAETVITTDDIIAEQPDMVKAFLKAEIQGWKDACNGETGYEEGAKLAVDTYGVDIDPALELDKEIEQARQQCELLVHTDETATNGIFTISDAMIADNIKSIAASGIDIAPEDLFDMGPLNELLAEDPSLIG